MRWAAVWLWVGVAWAGVAYDLPGTDGRWHSSEELSRHKATVLAFIATDCPISNRYAPKLARMAAEYAGRGVAFLGVHSDPSVAEEEIQRHAREFGLPFPVLLDRSQTLARATGVNATLEVAVLSPGGEVLYRGRVDDRYVDFGKTRPQALREDLRVALDEILAGKPVAQPVTRALGCAIPFRAQAAGADVTFARDVAPILYKNCVVCHRPGQSAPFPLLSYRDAARRADLIARVTASRYMPPWQPAAGYGHFAGERRLTATEIDTLRRWAQSGASEGDAARAPKPPAFPEGWQLGRPDLVARVAKPYAVAADGPDQYRCFVVPLGLERDRYVRAVEFRPSDRAVVHHALFFLDRSGLARRLDGGSGYSCFGLPGFLPSGALGGWTPGSFAIRMPADIPAPLRRGTDLVMQIHFHPTGKPESEQSELGIYFTERAPTRSLMDIALGSHAIDIPAGDRAYKVRDHFTVPVDVDAIGIIPHAHYICRDMKGWAILPDGRKKWLIWIRDWNFNWQEQYRYAAPVRLPEGTRLEMEFTYDNSEDNPRNPNHPPRRVVWGGGSRDEMAGLHVQVVPVRQSDAEELGQTLWGKIMRMVGGEFYRPPAAVPK